jgi:ubiquinone/menaquinone biosynthesis C-methylase UbiE
MSDSADSVKRYYRESDHARCYEDVRFANAGGWLIDALEQEIVNEFLEGHSPGVPILEIAAGTGRFSLMLARQGHAVTAVDSSPEMLDQLRKKADAEDLKITCVHADAFDLPFPDGAFPTVFSIRFVWHFENPTKVVGELARVSEKHVVFDLINRSSLAALTAPLSNKVFYRDLHTQLTTRRQALHVLRSAGLRLEAEKSAFAFPFICYRRMPAISRPLYSLDRFFLRYLPIGTLMYLKCQKANMTIDDPDVAGPGTPETYP